MHHKHRIKLYSLFSQTQESIIFLEGAKIMNRYQTDYEFAFRQESNFWYVSGVNEPDCAAILDIDSKEFHLFVPKRDMQYAVWYGYVKSLDQYRSKYSPDHVHYIDELQEVVKKLNPSIIFCLNESSQERIHSHKLEVTTDSEALIEALNDARVIKTEEELECLRKASQVNDEAYKRVIESWKPGMYEYQAKAIFTKVQMSNGLQQDAYNGIYASGPNSAILHYVSNNRQTQDGELFLIDAGFEYEGYAADFSRTFPVNGRFSANQAEVYEVVLTAQKQVIEAIKPGVRMEDLHMMSASTMMEGLLDMGIVKGSLNSVMKANIFALFFPHGLGHFLGLDTHDVGGYPKGVERIDRPGIFYLRARRELEAGMVVTIEPGIYFVPSVLEPALKDPSKQMFLNAEKLYEFMDFGGIRIEDDIVVTENGYENLTHIVKERDEIERLMNN
ncbi:MAG: Xaa-Pro aminopeptidase [Balneola sp.]|nr:Xaa-Pro aminopeptidase [Balneola sp.]|tara:strand:- start:9735 stop:11069 length:1335 start_codon:yes stop_codon:yes gene_type:complete